MPKYNPHREDNRDYLSEARNMTRGLGKTQCYELYEIVVEKLQRTPQGSTREKELCAVQAALEERRDLDFYRLQKVRKGYNSSMAAEARAKDGNTIKHQKRV